MDRAEAKIVARPWKPQDLLDDLQMYIDEENDSYLNGRRTAMCMARGYLKEFFKQESLAEKQATSKWVSVEERLPEINDTEPFASFVKDRGYQFIVADENGYVWVEMFWLKANKFDDPSVTHWMPLPEPPKEGAEG